MQYGQRASNTRRVTLRGRSRNAAGSLVSRRTSYDVGEAVFHAPKIPDAEDDHRGGYDQRYPDRLQIERRLPAQQTSESRR